MNHYFQSREIVTEEVLQSALQVTAPKSTGKSVRWKEICGNSAQVEKAWRGIQRKEIQIC